MKYFVYCQILGLCHDFLFELISKTNSQEKLKKEWDCNDAKLLKMHHSTFIEYYHRLKTNRCENRTLL